MFFHTLKPFLGCRHLLSDKHDGVEIQASCGMIACKLILIYTGEKPNRAMKQMGWYGHIGTRGSMLPSRGTNAASRGLEGRDERPATGYGWPRTITKPSLNARSSSGSHIRGAGPLIPHRERIVSRPLVSFYDLHAAVAMFDVNLAPLEVGNPFCEAKSPIRCTTATLVGVPSLVASTGPLVDWGFSGSAACSGPWMSRTVSPGRSPRHSSPSLTRCSSLASRRARLIVEAFGSRV